MLRSLVGSEMCIRDRLCVNDDGWPVSIEEIKIKDQPPPVQLEELQGKKQLVLHTLVTWTCFSFKQSAFFNYRGEEQIGNLESSRSYHVLALTIGSLLRLRSDIRGRARAPILRVENSKSKSIEPIQTQQSHRSSVDSSKLVRVDETAVDFRQTHNDCTLSADEFCFGSRVFDSRNCFAAGSHVVPEKEYAIVKR